MPTNTKRLTRSTHDRTIAGVCAGIAEYFGIDPVLVRALFVVATFSGPGLPIYIGLWIVMPEEKDVVKEKPKRVQVPDYEYENSNHY